MQSCGSGRHDKCRLNLTINFFLTFTSFFKGNYRKMDFVSPRFPFKKTNKHIQHSVKVTKLLSAIAHIAKDSMAEPKQNISNSNKVPVKAVFVKVTYQISQKTNQCWECHYLKWFPHCHAHFHTQNQLPHPLHLGLALVRELLMM